jgi:hypothetical protein
MGELLSSADTGAFGSGIELNAIQRNPNAKRANAIRGLVESDQPNCFYSRSWCRWTFKLFI